MREPDRELMRQIEDVLLPRGDDEGGFRRSMIGSIGAASLDKPGGEKPDEIGVIDMRVGDIGSPRSHEIPQRDHLAVVAPPATCDFRYGDILGLQQLDERVVAPLLQERSDVLVVRIRVRQAPKHRFGAAERRRGDDLQHPDIRHVPRP